MRPSADKENGGGRLAFRRRKYCKFCEDKVVFIDQVCSLLIVPQPANASALISAPAAPRRFRFGVFMSRSSPL